MSTALPNAAKIHGDFISQIANLTFQATRKALLIAVVLGFGMGSARAQLNTEVADVTAANNAFYTALSALDAAAMEKVWAHEFLRHQYWPSFQSCRDRISRCSGQLQRRPDSSQCTDVDKARRNTNSYQRKRGLGCWRGNV